MRAGGVAQRAEDRQHRCQPGAAGEQQYRAVGLAQEERPVGTGEGDGVADGGALRQIARHRTARGKFHQEGEPFVVRGVGEGVRALLVGAGYRDVDVLPWEEGQLGAVGDVHADGDGSGREPIELRQRTAVGGGLGLGDVGCRGDLQHEVRAGPHAAGQHVAGGRLFGGQRVVDVGAAVVVARLAQRLAGAAGAVAAVQRDVDPLAVGGVGDGLVVPAGDEPGDPVLEGQGDRMGFGVGPGCHRRAPQKW